MFYFTYNHGLLIRKLTVAKLSAVFVIFLKGVSDQTQLAVIGHKSTLLLSQNMANIRVPPTVFLTSYGVSHFVWPPNK